MIYTLTLNPSIDYVIDVENLELGKVNRTSKDFKFPGGKGINVSRILGNQKIDNIALGFLGGFTGKFIEDNLKALGVKTEFIKVKGDSRINVKIKSNEETEINGAGPMITSEELDSLFNRLNQLVEGDILVLAGSIPSTLPKDLYLQIQKRVSKKNVKVVVDTSGKALLEAIKNKPFLIKPNNHEIEEIFDVKINSEKELIKYGKDLVSLGAENVIISMAGDGDSLVGGFLAKYVETKDLIASFKNGIASGSASAFSLDLALAEDVNKLLPIIKIEKYEEV